MPSPIRERYATPLGPSPFLERGLRYEQAGLTDKARAHWSYQPVKDPAVPEVQTKGWVKTPVDNFILAKLKKKISSRSRPGTNEL